MARQIVTAGLIVGPGSDRYPDRQAAAAQAMLIESQVLYV